MFWNSTKSKKEAAELQFSELMQAKGFSLMGEFAEQDIFIAGFPKSGNTWMQHLMAGMNYSTDMSAISNLLVRDLIPDVHQGQYYKRYQERMIFKTHLLPQMNYKKAIFLVRDPRDAINSFYQMQRGRGINLTISEIVSEKKGLFSTWNEHVQAWSNNQFNADLIVIKYEDLVENTLASLEQINAFFKFGIEKDMLQKIVSNCTFAKMREKESSVFWGKGKDWQEGKFFVRKGIKGSFKEDLGPDDIKLIESTCSDLMKKFNY